ncbi:MAG: hypothetical protein R6X29_02415 [Acidimicrobiia bacterium]|jgi:uncharacterized protein YjbJ (UPF0337 family)
MEAKTYLYAAVGAPVVAGRAVQGTFESLRQKLTENRVTLTKETKDLVAEWAVEGEKALDRLGEGKMVDELTAKVDFDQMQEQVGKLRDQLEDMLETWRTNFRPAERAEGMMRKAAGKMEEAAEKVEEAAEKVAKPAAAAAKKPAAKKPAAKKPAAKKPAATTAKKPAAPKPAPEATKAS